MIIGTTEVLPVGVLDEGLSDAEGGEHPKQPFVVLREVSEAEWRDYIRAETGEEPVDGVPEGARFYEISTD